jgi:hypothetical protein
VTREFNNGIFFYGTTGTIFTDDSRVVIFPTGRDAKKEEIAIPTPTMQENHVKNFLDAVRLKDKNLLSCTPDDAFQSTATVQLAMISYNSGSIIRWNEDKKEIIGNPDASKLLKREYRGKYIHP